jgi:hypothetical protein
MNGIFRDGVTLKNANLAVTCGAAIYRCNRFAVKRNAAYSRFSTAKSIGSDGAPFKVEIANGISGRGRKSIIAFLPFSKVAYT